MSELDDLEAYESPDRARIGSATAQKKYAACRNRDRNARERAVMRSRRNRLSDREADAIYARVLAEIRART